MNHSNRRYRNDDRRGAALVLLTVMIVAVLGTLALAVDQGLLRWVRTHLQGAADVAALAAVQELPDLSNVRDTAVAYGARNARNWGAVVHPDDVARGRWTLEGGFVAGGTPYNAVSVVARRSEANDNPVNLLFARVLGVARSGVSASAVALFAGESVAAEFLMDEDVVDPDVESIVDLANELNRDPLDLVTAPDPCGTRWQDRFLPIPPDRELRLPVPTGDGGGPAGLFDIRDPAFEFTPGGQPSLEEFLNASSCEGENAGLNPLLGPIPRNDEDWYLQEYGEYGTGTAQPGSCMISPVFGDPIAYDEAGGSVDVGGGRGLLAYRILGAEPSAGGGPLFLVIETCDPEALLGAGGLSEVGLGGDRYRLVR